MKPVQAAAVDRALAASDPTVARRHLRLVAALEGTEPTAPLVAAGVATVVLAADPPAGPPVPPTPGFPDDETAVRGAALAVARFDRSLDRVAASADLPRSAVRRALEPI